MYNVNVTQGEASGEGSTPEPFPHGVRQGELHHYSNILRCAVCVIINMTLPWRPTPVTLSVDITGCQSDHCKPRDQRSARRLPSGRGERTPGDTANKH